MGTLGVHTVAGTKARPFNKNNIPDVEHPEWKLYVKTVPTRMIRMSGPFYVWTSETDNEPFRCQDGFLAVDARGYPYAIHADEHEKIYTPVEEYNKRVTDNKDVEEGQPDITDFQMRVEALREAVIHHQYNGSDGGESVNATAAVFYKFLKGTSTQ